MFNLLKRYLKIYSAFSSLRQATTAIVASCFRLRSFGRVALLSLLFGGCFDDGGDLGIASQGENEAQSPCLTQATTPHGRSWVGEPTRKSWPLEPATIRLSDYDHTDPESRIPPPPICDKGCELELLAGVAKKDDEDPISVVLVSLWLVEKQSRLGYVEYYQAFEDQKKAHIETKTGQEGLGLASFVLAQGEARLFKYLLNTEQAPHYRERGVHRFVTLGHGASEILFYRAWMDLLKDDKHILNISRYSANEENDLQVFSTDYRLTLTMLFEEYTQLKSGQAVLRDSSDDDAPYTRFREPSNLFFGSARTGSYTLKLVDDGN